MRCYASSGDVTFAGTTKTVITVIASSTRRPKIQSVKVSCTDSPADATAVFAVRRFTADGTGTSGTPIQADSADGAPSCTVKVNYSVEPTYSTGNIDESGLNQRALMIWEPPEGADPSCPLGTSNGIGIVMVSGPNLKYRVTIVWEE